MIGDWTKGGRWTRATIYHYGKKGGLTHLCFYDEESFEGESCCEFEITQLIGSPDMVCMLYPLVNKAALIEELEAWYLNSEDHTKANWAASISFEDGVRVELY